MFKSFFLHRWTLKSKWKGNDQELIQSNPTSQPQNQKGKKGTNIDTKNTHSKLSQIGGHSASLTENSSNVYFYHFCLF